MQKSRNFKSMFLCQIAIFSLCFFSFIFFSPVSLNTQNFLTATAQGETLPADYFLYNTSLQSFPQNSQGLTPNVENQYQSDLCWAFSTLTALETTIYKTGLVNKTVPLNFSELDLAYNVQTLSRGWDRLGGGAFEVAYEYLSSDNGPVIEQAWEESTEFRTYWQSSPDQLASRYASEITTYGRGENAGFSALEAYFFPSREATILEDARNNVAQEVTEQKIINNRNNIKSHILNNGAVTASMYIGDGSTYFSDSLYYYFYNNNNEDHMVALVGWDDNIVIKGAVGAYIVQNSYGTASHMGNGGFFYIAYDDTLIENNVCAFKRVGISLTDTLEYDNMRGSDYENQFVTYTDAEHKTFTLNYFNLTTSSYTANFYEISNIYQRQYISRIKVPTVSVRNLGETSFQNFKPTTFKVYVLNGLNSNLSSALSSNFGSKTPVLNKYATGADPYLFESNQTGYYTIELDTDMQLSGSYFAVIYEITNGNLLHKDNSSTDDIAEPTYFSSSPSSTWLVYDSSPNNPSSGVECVLPMIVQAKYDLMEMDCNVFGKSVIYDGGFHNPIIEVSTPNTYTVKYSLDGENFTQNLPNFKNVKIVGGSVSPYNVYVKIEASNYATVTQMVEITINPRTLVIIPNSVTRIYGEPYMLPTVSILQGLVNTETAGRTGRMAAEGVNESGLNNVGEYNIIQNTFILVNSVSFIQTNYTISFQTRVKYIVTPKTITLVPEALSKFYGDADFVLTFHFDGVEGEQNPKATATLMREAGENVGQFTVSLFGEITLMDDSGSGFYANNYVAEFSQMEHYFAIVPRVITVTPDLNQKKIFGENDPVLTFTFQNTISGEVPVCTGALSREVGEDAGNYAITKGDLTLINGENFLANNYVLEFYSQIVYFKISLGTIENNFVDDITVSYDGEEHYVEHTATEDFTVLYCEFENENDSFDEQYAQSENVGGRDAGVYFVGFKFIHDNYEPKFETAKITINPRVLAVKPYENQSKIYGENDEILFYFENNVTGEIPAFSGALSREMGENVGEYLITAKNLALENGEIFFASNYFLSFDNADGVKYEITRRKLIITPDENQNKLYGKTDPIFTFLCSNLAFNDALDFTGLLSREAGSDVGEYLILPGTLALGGSLDGNYYIEFNDTVAFRIVPVGVRIKIKDKIHYYGELVPDSFGYLFIDNTDANFVTGDDLELSYSFLDGEENPIELTQETRAGTYYITAQSANENYAVTVERGEFVISYMDYIVTFKIEAIQRGGGVLGTTKVKNVTHFSQVGELPSGIPLEPSVENILNVSGADVHFLTGYTFVNWQKNVGTGWVDVSDITSEEITGTTTFRANMQLISYKITYHLDGGTLYNAKLSYVYTEDDFTLSAPVKRGYDFLGWYTSSDFSGEMVGTVSATSQVNLDFYANWVIQDYSITLPPATTGLSVTPSVIGSITFGATFTLEVNLDLSHNRSYDTMQVFVKWGRTPDEPEELTPQRVNAEDGDGVKYIYTISGFDDDFEIVISGVTINVYEVVFVAIGSEVARRNVVHGGTLAVADFPEIPSKEHYDDTPAVWSVQTDIIGTGDMVISAVYTPNIYTVTFVMADGSEIQVNVAYGSPVDTSALEGEYKLNIFEYFIFAKPLDKISSNEVIGVSVGSNIHIFYIVLGVLAGVIVLVFTASIVRKQRRRLAVPKISKAEYKELLEREKTRLQRKSENIDSQKK